MRVPQRLTMTTAQKDGMNLWMGYGSRWVQKARSIPQIGMLLIFAFGALGIPSYRLANKHGIEVSGDHANSRYPDLIVHSPESFTAIEGRSEACVELTDPNPMLVIESQQIGFCYS